LARYAATTPLSLAHLSELQVPPRDLVDLAARAGFASIGLRIAPAVPGGIAYPLTGPGERRALRRRLADAGVGLLYIELLAITRDLDPAAHRPMIETGAELGATRLAVTGDDADRGLVAAKMAELCDIAGAVGIAVDLEFMAFRAVRSLEEALEIVRRTGRSNAHVLVDALHFCRSGSGLDTLADADPRLIGGFQLCDAPGAAPAGIEALAREARTDRRLPGAGALPLHALVAAIPDWTPLGLELPIAGQYPNLDPVARATLMVRSTRSWLSARTGSDR
jgi:sugar phosphate isomerase/epimerase